MKKITVKNEKKILNIACIALGVIIVVLLALLIHSICVYAEARKGYDEIKNEAVIVVDQKSNGQVAPSKSDETLSSESGESVPATVDFEQLEKINKDVKAWLYAPDLDISYPVVQGKDNIEYMDRTFSKKENQAGALFFDCRNSLEDSELENWIIYGHRMKDNSMFGRIPRYGNGEFYQEHPKMYLLTPQKDYKIEIFACRKVTADEKYYPVWFESAEDRQQYTAKAGQQSFFTSIYSERTDCPIITLSTCSSRHGEDEKRVLLHGWLVPIDSIN